MGSIVALAAAAGPGCGDSFEGCEASRTCSPRAAGSGPGGHTGAAGEAQAGESGLGPSGVAGGGRGGAATAGQPTMTMGGEAGQTEPPQGGRGGSPTTHGEGGENEAGSTGQAGEVQGGGGAGPICDRAPETLLCGDTCVDPKTDDTNCGDCGQRCTGAATCTNGSCLTCPEGCAVLQATLSLPDGILIFEMPFTTAVDLSAATVTARIYCASTTGIILSMVVETADNVDDAQSTTYLDRADGWQIVTTDTRTLTHEATGINIFLNPLDYIEPPPNLSLYIDWIRVSDGAAGPWEFAVNGNPIVADEVHSDGVPVVDWRGP